jgi:integrase
MESNLAAPVRTPDDTFFSAPEEAEQLPLYEAGSIDLRELRRNRDEYRGPRHSGETVRCYASDWKSFCAWCAEAGRRAMPASGETVTFYITWLLTKRHRRAVTAARHIGAIVDRYRRAGMDPPDIREAREIVSNIRRRRRERPRGKTALTPDALRAMLVALDPQTPRGARDRAMIILGFASSLRRSEIAGLQLSDITFRPEGMAVNVRFSKTDQEGRGRTVAVWRGVYEMTDPVAAVMRWIQVRGDWAGPLFTAVNGGHGRPQSVQKTGILGEVVAKSLKTAARRAGLDDEGFSGHSLRAGAVTAAANAGSSQEEIMKMSGHTNLQTMRRYIRDVTAFGGRNPLEGVL